MKCWNQKLRLQVTSCTGQLSDQIAKRVNVTPHVITSIVVAAPICSLHSITSCPSQTACFTFADLHRLSLRLGLAGRRARLSGDRVHLRLQRSRRHAGRPQRPSSRHTVPLQAVPRKGVPGGEGGSREVGHRQAIWPVVAPQRYPASTVQ